MSSPESPSSLCAMPRTVRVLRAVVSGAAFFAGVLLASYAIRSQLPMRDVQVVRPKLEYLAAHTEEYDTLLLGSSRVAFQLLPSILDETMAAGGVHLRTFNAAVAGMRPPEDGYLLDLLLEHPPKHLRWVVLELQDLRASFDSHRGTVRSLYWHDWTRTRLVAQSAFSKVAAVDRKKHRPLSKRADDWLEASTLVCEHLSLLLTNSVNLGRGPDFVEQFLRGKPKKDHSKVALGSRQDGYTPAFRSETMNENERSGLEKGVADRRAKPAKPDYADATSQYALGRMIQKIEKLGARVVLLVPPTVSRHNFYPLPEVAKQAIILDYSDIAKYADLYKNEHRYDREHVNIEGSRLFTRVFAEEWLARLHSESRPFEP